MKKLIFTTFFAAILFASCNNESIPESFDIGKIEEFHHGEINQASDNALKFSITEINDSRCPSDVVCVWEGKADVKIVVESPQPGSIVLSTYDNLIDTVGNFSFEIIEVLPYPISTQTIELEDYNVTLKIEELDN